ncbi:MAG: patatin-like phospholipase family protein, partial [Candidatus Omnitrophica bacterium]|nr:patatin-like phospholipase family protein [Candidatus Omnitrophota bacterium]
MRPEIKKRLYVFAITVFLISGCASARHAVPLESLSSARVFGMQDIRALSGCPSDSFKKDFASLLGQEKEAASNPGAGREYAVLVISGGGSNGAYGAGLLCGWSQAGTRPVFKIVTGISTGAIIAPIAFLGSGYDDRLKEFYTRYSARDIARIRFPFNNSFASSRPLERLIERHFD